MNGGRGLNTIHYSLCNVYCFFVNLSSPNFQILFYRVSFFLFAQPPRFALIPFVFSLRLIALQLWFGFSFLCCYTLLFLSCIILFCLLL